MFKGRQALKAVKALCNELGVEYRDYGAGFISIKFWKYNSNNPDGILSELREELERERRINRLLISELGYQLVDGTHLHKISQPPKPRKKTTRKTK